LEFEISQIIGGDRKPGQREAASIRVILIDQQRPLEFQFLEVVDLILLVATVGKSVIETFHAKGVLKIVLAMQNVLFEIGVFFEPH